MAANCIAFICVGQPGPPNQGRVPPPPQHPPPQAQICRPVPDPPPRYPLHSGGWYGGSPAEGLLPGWSAYRDQDGKWVFQREGRDGVETYHYHPRILAEVECIGPSHYLHAASYPILQGQWHPERDVIVFLCGKLYSDSRLVHWAYYESGRVFEEERVFPDHIPLYMYPQGDQRPRHMRGIARLLPDTAHLPPVKQPPQLPQIAQQVQPPVTNNAGTAATASAE